MVGILFWIIGLSIISSCAYRFGGSAKRGDCLDFFRNKLTRRLGCAILQFVAIFFVLKISAPWWVHLLSIGITFGFTTTYWDGVTPYGADSHGLHGAGIAFGMILYVVTGCIPWTTFLLRIILLGGFMELWCRMHTNDVMEEVGRGMSIPLSLLLFCV